MITLYHNDISTCSQKARLCLAEKGLAWEDRHIICAPASIRPIGT